MNYWSAASLALITCTIGLQLVNYKKFHQNGNNSTRVTLIIKEFCFSCHAIMLWYVTDLVKTYYSGWFGQVFGVMFFLGVLCWFLVFLRGLYENRHDNNK